MVTPPASDAVAPPADALLRLVLDTTRDAYVSMDEAGRVTDWNPASEVLFGWSRDEALGRRLEDLVIPARLRAAHRDGLRRFLAGGEGRITGRRLTVPGVDRTGRELSLEVTIAPLRIGDHWRFSAFMRQAAEPVVAPRLQGAGAERQRVRSFDWAVRASSTEWSEPLCRLHGAPVHPEDRAHVREAIGRALADADELDVEYRTVDHRVMHAHASILHDAAGAPVRVLGTVRDITERVRRAAHDRRLHALVEALQDAVLTVDAAGSITTWNRGAAALYGHAASDAIGRPIGLLTPRDRAGEEWLLVGRALAGECVTGHETRQLGADGAMRDVALTVAPVRDGDGQIVEILFTARDITARKRAERDLERYVADLEALAIRDPATGLLTHRELHGLLERELARARREEGTCSLLLVAPPPASEPSVLRELADVLRAVSGTGQEACRFDEHDLAVVLPDTGPGPAMALAQRIRQEWLRRDATGTLSTGSATWPQEAADKDALIARARAALRWSRPSPARPPAPAAEQATIEQILALLRRHLGMDVAHLSEFVGDDQIVRLVDADGPHPGLGPGARVPLADSYCRRMVDGDIDHVVRDTAAEPGTAALELTRTASIGCYVGVPVRLSDGRLYGSLCCVGRAPRLDLAGSAAHFARVCARLVADLLEQRRLEIENHRLHAELASVRALLAALDARDRYTGEHSEAVVALAAGVARRLSLGAHEIAAVEQVALLHDIGKIGVPDAILQKPGGLTAEEWAVMRQHSAIGARIVASIPALAHLAPAIRGEHEHWDGGGYPDGLRGAAIPRASRIILACDAYHAMTSDRPYRAALGSVAAVTELRRCAGHHFDPTVVQALVEHLAAIEGPPRDPQPARFSRGSAR